MGGSGVDELTHSQGTLNGVSLIQTINVPGQNLQAAGVEGSHILLAHTLTYTCKAPMATLVPFLSHNGELFFLQLVKISWNLSCMFTENRDEVNQSASGPGEACPIIRGEARGQFFNWELPFVPSCTGPQQIKATLY